MSGINRYNNSSILIPVRLWTFQNSNLFRIELPSETLTTNTEWIFDNVLSTIPEWKLYTSKNNTSIFYGLNPIVIPPHPKGTLLVHIHQNPVHPYNTTYIETAQDLDVKPNINQIFFYTYSIPNTLPLYVSMSLSMYNEIITNLFIEPNTNDSYLRRIAQSEYKKVYFLLTERNDYWKGTSEDLCIPCNKSEKKKYNTLKECQNHVYSNIKNRHVWVENNNDPLWSYMQWWNKLSPSQQIDSLTSSLT